MRLVHEASPPGSLLCEADRQKVLEQMNRMLETHLFKNSRRYPALLRFIVEETLEGRGEYLKERLLGVRVFDRRADYDTAADPIVRVTIAEIRKRIAQYYHDEEHDPEIRIELLPGRYAPEFKSGRDLGPDRPHPYDRLDSQPVPQLVGQPRVSHPIPEETSAWQAPAETQSATGRKAWSSRTPLYLTGILVLLLLGAGILTARSLRPSAVDQMWTPILASQGAVLLCLPTDVGKHADAPGSSSGIAPASPAGRILPSSNPAGPTFLDYESLGENVVYSDMLAALKVADVLALRHRAYRVRLNIWTTLGDLKQGPNVLIGGLDNQWTMRALASLRFHFAGSDDQSYWIADTNNPANRSWSLDLKQQYANVNRDYAIVARLHNEQTEQPQVIVAGIGMSGTAAAGEFLGDPHRMEELRQRVGPGFREHDFEAVLSTDVVNGIAGSPKILAVSVW